ncbi:MAG: hypothetical protein K2I91_05275, partial [Muribaculaceae bacterium]|nr:hypothetical protein [Muribaculaceae bacterium]
MLGALSLLLGGRADTKTVTDSSRKTIVEAHFSNGLIVRREISPNGRSRAFIDDSPVTLQQLEETTSALIDIHSQHATLTLNSREGQLKIIDTFADNNKLLGEYRELFRNFVATRNHIKELKEETERNREMRGLLEYRLEILEKLNPKTGELAEVEQRYDLLSEADRIRHFLAESYNSLDADEGALSSIMAARNALDNINMSLVDDDADTEDSIVYRLQSLYVELKDIAETIQSLASGIESNPQALSRTAARMNALYEAKRQFKVSDADELVTLREELRNRLQSLNNAETDISEIEGKARVLASKLKEKSAELTERRRRAAGAFAELLENRARPLGLANLTFKVDILSGKLTSDGGDNIEFLCSFNKNGVLLPMSKTASGGELSRLTLAIKSIMAEKMEMPTVIFDEIDTGVSGEIADKMGKMMGEMSANTQILAITHLPQVAAKGQRHYKVFKEDREERTISHI